MIGQTAVRLGWSSDVSDFVMVLASAAGPGGAATHRGGTKTATVDSDRSKQLAAFILPCFTHLRKLCTNYSSIHCRRLPDLPLG